MDVLGESVLERGGVPLVWAGATLSDTAVDVGDALSPVIVALCSGQPVQRVPARAAAARVSAAGTIGQTLAGGRVVVWGTGCDQSGKAAVADTELILRATRGPYSRALLGGGAQICAYGDPLWLLPRFYRPAVEKRWELGVVLEAAELAEPTPGAGPRADCRRYAIPAGLAGRVRLISPLAPPGPAGLRDKLDEILACARIVSASLAGLVLAESYGIPCLAFSPAGPAAGLARLPTTADGGLEHPVADFYAGLRISARPVYVQSRLRPTDWEQVIRAVDAAWNPVWLREDDLLDNFPLPFRPLAPPPGAGVFDHPVVQSLAFRHDPAALQRAEARLPREPRHPPTAANPAAGLQEWVERHGKVPLSWAAASPTKPWPNLGDALSAVIVGAMTGLPVQRRNFDDPGERLVAVGTIGHAQRRGGVHLWGTALDPRRNAFDASQPRFRVPPETRFAVHATRGRFTAARLREEGIPTPPVYGDPVWFLPRLTAARHVATDCELGVVLHISELAEPRPGAPVLAAYRRYEVPPALARSVRIIDTFTGQGLESLLGKVDELRACRRIASTSFHGLVIAEAYGIPNVWFGPDPVGGQVLDIEDETVPIDHRMRDWYSGTSKLRLPVFGADRLAPTPWEKLMRWIDHSWTPLATDAAALFDAFPLPVRVSLHDPLWPIAPAVAESLQKL